jgi:PAS domain S-box-containing protein
MKKILVVDNDLFFLKLLKGMLEKDGYNVVTAEGGLAALDILKDLTPDVILIDLVMPNIDGRKLCKIIQSMPKLNKTHRIILSAITAEESIDLEELGIKAVITKGSTKDMHNSIKIVLTEILGNPQDFTPSEQVHISKYYSRGIVKELISVQKHFQIILDRMSEGMLVLTKDGRILFANSMFLSIVSIPEEKLIGSWFVDLFQGHQRRRVDEMIKTLGSVPQKISEEDPIDLDGNQIILTLVPINENDSTISAIITDVTKRKLAEKALKKAMEYTENIIDTMADALIVLDSDLAITLVNRAALELSGYNEKELIGKDIDMILDDGLSFKDELLKHISRKASIKRPIMFYKTKSGERMPVSFIGSPLYEENGSEDPIGIICIAHDISEIEKLNAQIRQAEKIAATGILSSGIAHELKNPLAIIMQGLDALNFKIASMRKKTEFAGITDRIMNAAERADKIIEGLLDFSKQTPSAFEKLDPVDLITEALSIFEPQFKKKNIEIIRRFAPEVPWVYADRNQMQQVMINLLVNASDAMPEGGRIAIGVSEKASGDKRSVEILCSDTGTGMSREVLSRVFEPFFSTKIDSLSTGLGLSISKGIIEKHCGSIEIKSKVKEGTTIRILLPCEK